MGYDYPGNVRELINILDRATALEESDFDLLMREHKELNAGLAGNLELKSGRIPDRLEDARCSRSTGRTSPMRPRRLE